jgi:hypothetical protein
MDLPALERSALPLGPLLALLQVLQKLRVYRVRVQVQVLLRIGK